LALRRPGHAAQSGVSRLARHYSYIWGEGPSMEGLNLFPPSQVRYLVQKRTTHLRQRLTWSQFSNDG